jgi:hypothetical protein
MGILSSLLNTYKPPGRTFNLIRKHVSLKELESCLKGGQHVQFLRDKRPFKKRTPKDGRNIMAIARKLLTLVYVSIQVLVSLN